MFISNYFSCYMRMMYYRGIIEKISDTFEINFGNNSFYFELNIKKIYEAIVNKSYYLADFCVPLSSPL